MAFIPVKTMDDVLEAVMPPKFNKNRKPLLTGGKPAKTSRASELAPWAGSQQQKRRRNCPPALFRAVGGAAGILMDRANGTWFTTRCGSPTRASCSPASTSRRATRSGS